MNRRMILHILGKILLAEAALMIPAAIVGAVYQESETWTFFPAIGILLLLGILFGWRKPRNSEIYSKDGLFIVAAAWVLLSLIGAVPFYLCGGFATVWDCIFEMVSGLTTTGATVLSAPESLPKCILFWRSFSHWIGGMGVLVFVLAIMPLSDERAMHLMRAEVPGPTVGKLVPKMRDTAKILYGVYTVLTVVLTVLLLCGGMPVFDALCTAFGTAGTGGFAVRNAGIAFYNSAYIDIVLSVFMLLFGINFNLFYFVLIGKAKELWKSEELHWYLGIIACAVAAIAASIYRIYGSVGSSLRYAFFQVTSIISSTGFATADFNLWPQIARHILVLLMFIGACAGSTGGGLKVSRVLLLGKCLLQEVRKLFHPHAVTVVRLEKKAVSPATCHITLVYFAMYMCMLLVSTLLLSLDGMDLTTNLTAAITCINNIGPGLNQVGPMSNFGGYSGFSKVLLSLDMLFGRLEIFPMLVLLSPSAWRECFHKREFEGNV